MIRKQLRPGCTCGVHTGESPPWLHGIRWSIALRNFIFPPSCYSCGTLLRQHHRPALCDACRGRVVCRVHAPIRCYHLAHARLCDDGLCCRPGGTLSFCRRRAGSGPAPRAEVRGADRHRTGTGCQVGDGGRRSSPGRPDIDIIVPLPLFRAKQRERGYNQSESIARGIAQMLRRPVRPRLVRRTRWTDSQTTLGFAARQMNVQRRIYRPPREKPPF